VSLPNPRLDGTLGCVIGPENLMVYVVAGSAVVEDALNGVEKNLSLWHSGHPPGMLQGW